jgi:hypothetical protein
VKLDQSFAIHQIQLFGLSLLHVLEQGGIVGDNTSRNSEETFANTRNTVIIPSGKLICAHPEYANQRQIRLVFNSICGYNEKK